MGKLYSWGEHLILKTVNFKFTAVKKQIKICKNSYLLKITRLGVLTVKNVFKKGTNIIKFTRSFN
jgi:hypothetical protein